MYLESLLDEQDTVTQEINRQQKRLLRLQEQDRLIREDQDRHEIHMKRLRDSLPENNRLFLEYGMELERRATKRARTDDNVARKEDFEDY
jgi:hypothetical protein